MRDRVRHTHDRLALHWLVSLEIKLAGYAAHKSEVRDQKSEIRGLAMEIFACEQTFPSPGAIFFNGSIAPFIEVGVFEFTGGLGQTPI